MRISDWDSDVCASALTVLGRHHRVADGGADILERHPAEAAALEVDADRVEQPAVAVVEPRLAGLPRGADVGVGGHRRGLRSEEHTSELQSLMRISYAVFCLKKKNKKQHIQKTNER